MRSISTTIPSLGHHLITVLIILMVRSCCLGTAANNTSVSSASGGIRLYALAPPVAWLREMYNCGDDGGGGNNASVCHEDIALVFFGLEDKPTLASSDTEVTAASIDSGCCCNYSSALIIFPMALQRKGPKTTYYPRGAPPTFAELQNQVMQFVTLDKDLGSADEPNMLRRWPDWTFEAGNDLARPLQRWLEDARASFGEGNLDELALPVILWTRRGQRDCLGNISMEIGYTMKEGTG